MKQRLSWKVLALAACAWVADPALAAGPREGPSDPLVVEMQQKLNTLGVTPPLDLDGRLGTRTRAVMKSLLGTSTFGQVSRAKLSALIAAKANGTEQARTPPAPAAAAEPLAVAAAPAPAEPVAVAAAPAAPADPVPAAPAPAASAPAQPEGLSPEKGGEDPAAPPAFPEVTPPGEPGEPGEPAAPGESIETAFQNYQDKVTVSSGARSQSLADIPMTLTYLSAEDIEGTGQFTLCDTIQLFPGLECRRGAMRQATVSTRGLGFNFMSNRLLMLKDGRPETDPWTGSFLADESNPLTNVKQIEVIRGPGSSLYGSNAFAGVINYVTRSPDDVIKEGNQVGTDARLLIGQHSTYRGQATVAGKVKDLKGLVSYYYGASEGSPQFSDPVREIVDTQQWTRVHQVAGKVEFKNVKFDASYTDSLIAHPGGNPTAVVGNCGRCHYSAHDNEKNQIVTAQAVVDVPASSWLSFSARGFVNLKRRVATVENMLADESTPAVSARLRAGGDVRTNLTVGPLNVVAGADLKADEVDTQNHLPGLRREDFKSKSYGVFADAEVKFARRLILGGGVRYDAFDVSQNLWKNNTAELSPRASIVFHALPTLSLRANYGHAFRAPTMVELGIFQRMYASTLLGNPYLKPERLDTVEFAVDGWPFGEVMRLTATGFYTIADNFINEVPINSATAEFRNIGGGTMAGAELEVASQVPKLNTSVNLSYQFLHTEMNSTKLPFDYAASHRVQFRTRTGIGGAAFVDIYGAYVGPRADPGLLTDEEGSLDERHIILPGYFIASARVGWKIVEGLSVSAGVTNMFDSKYEETSGFHAAGTQLFAEVKFVY